MADRWTGLYYGVCAVNKKHRFHCDVLTPIQTAVNRPDQMVGVDRICCGQPIKFEKVMSTVEVKSEDGKE